MRSRCWAAAAAAITVAASAAGLTGVPPAKAQEVVLWVDGTTGISAGAPGGSVDTAETLLGGTFRGRQIATIDYPAALWPVTGLQDPTLGASVEIGTAKLVDAARSTVGPLVMAGVSQGALVVQQAQALLSGDPAIRSDSTFYLIADPNLGVGSGLHGAYVPILDYRPRPVAETRFTTIIVTNQYDGFSDPIARPWNLLALANAAMGISVVHPTAQNSDLSTVPAENITTTVNSLGGTTITYRVPTRRLPLTTPLRAVGVPDEMVDDIDAALRPMIDNGYRPLPKPVLCGAAATDRFESVRRGIGTRTARPVPSAAVRTGDSSSPRGAAGTSVRRSPGR